MKFTHKIMLTPLLAALAFGAVFWLGWRGTTASERLTDRIRDQFYVMVEHGQELELLAERIPATLQSAMTAADPEMIDEAALLRDRFHEVLDDVRVVPGVAAAQFDTLGVLCDDYFAVARLATAQLIDSGIDVSDEVYANLAVMHRRHERLLTGVHGVAEGVRTDMQARLDEASRRAEETRRLISAAVVVCLVLMFGLSLIASVSIVRPVRRLRMVSEDVARGDMDTPLDYRADDDLGRLADAFRTMRTSLADEFARRSEAEAALRESEERLSLALDAANDGLWDCDLTTGDTYASARFAEILGYGPDELPRNMEDQFRLFHPEDGAHAEQAFEAHLAHGFPYDVEIRMRHRDGSWCWVHQRGKVVARNDEGEPLRMIGTIVDIRTRKLAEEQLVERTVELEQAIADLRTAQGRLIQTEKQASLGQMAAGLAHELNNPIGALRASTDVMARAEGKLDGLLAEVECLRVVREDPRVEKALRALSEGRANAADAAARVGELVGALKSFTHLDEADLQRVDLVQGIESALMVVRPDYGERIRVVREYGDVPEIVCWPAELNQAILNLLSNAARAIDGEGTVTVSTALQDDRVRISVADTGRGIAPEDLDRLFDPTFTTSDDRVRMGWGLTAVDQTARKHGGEVVVESEVGAGAVFAIVLPVEKS